MFLPTKPGTWSVFNCNVVKYNKHNALTFPRGALQCEKDVPVGTLVSNKHIDVYGNLQVLPMADLPKRLQHNQ